MINNFFRKNKGFSLIEIVVGVTIFSIIVLVIAASIFAMNASNSRLTSSMGLIENSRTALERIIFEIKSAKSVYTPTTSEHQLSLETSKYILSGESTAFIDFFLCGSAICMKKEFQNAFELTPSSLNVTDLSFSQIATGSASAIQVSFTANAVKFSSTASLRKNK